MLSDFKFRLEPTEQREFTTYYHQLKPPQVEAFDSLMEKRGNTIATAELCIVKWLAEDRPDGIRHLVLEKTRWLERRAPNVYVKKLREQLKQDELALFYLLKRQRV